MTGEIADTEAQQEPSDSEELDATDAELDGEERADEAADPWVVRVGYAKSGRGDKPKEPKRQKNPKPPKPPKPPPPPREQRPYDPAIDKPWER